MENWITCTYTQRREVVAAAIKGPQLFDFPVVVAIS